MPVRSQEYTSSFRQMPLRAVALTPRLLAACFNGLSKSVASISLVSTSGLLLLLLSSPAFRRVKTLPEEQSQALILGPDSRPAQRFSATCFSPQQIKVPSGFQELSWELGKVLSARLSCFCR